MNCKSGDVEDRLVDLDKPRVELAILIRDDDPTGNAKVAVEPGVPDTATVCFDAHLEVARLGTLRDRPHLCRVE